MSYSEAVEAVGKLIGAFPNGSPANAKGYIGALAAVLVDYARVVSAKCADPLQGVARDTRFLPTVADLVGWCERERQSLQQIVDRDDFNRERAKEALERKQHESELAEQRKARPTLQQMKDQYGPNWGIGAHEQQDLMIKAAATVTLEKANRKAFERECKAAGVDPARMGMSPSLAMALGSSAVIQEARMRKAELLGREADKLAAAAE